MPHGEMDLYLRWLNKYERREEEDAPIGLILFAGKKEETVRLIDLECLDVHLCGAHGLNGSFQQCDFLIRQEIEVARAFPC